MGWNYELPRERLLNDGRLKTRFGQRLAGGVSEVEAQRRFRNEAGTQRRRQPLTKANATAFPTLSDRDERAGNDERRAGAILARPPCQFPPVGPGGFIPD